MIAFTHEDKVYLAIPMGIHSRINKAEVDYEYEENWDAFFADDDTNTIIAVDAAYDRTIDLIRYSGIFDGCSVTKKSLYAIKPKIDLVLEDTNADVEKKEYGLLVARNDKMYEIRSCGLVIEHCDFERIGESRQYSYAVYENVKHIDDPVERINKYYKQIEHLSGRSAFPVVVINTGSKEHTMLY